jgi:hypothetical protein
MTRHRTMRWFLACSAATSLGTAYAGPEECLTLRDNLAVAQCANKFAPGTSFTSTPPQRQPSPPAHQPIEAAERWLLFPVPAPGQRVAEPKREAPEVVAERDRSELIRRSEVGAVGLAALGLVFGAWRWRASTIKTCASCGTRVTPGAAVCKRCYRSV